MKFISIKKHFHKKNIYDLLWLIFGQGVTFVLGIFITKQISKIGPEEFGKYSLILTIQGFINLVYFGPAEQSFLRFFYDYEKKGDAHAYTKLMVQFLRNSGVSILFLFVLAGIYLQIALGGYLFLYLSAIGLFLMMTLINPLLISFLNLLKYRKINSVLQIGERVLAYSTLLLFYWWISPSITIILFSFSFSLLVIIVYRVFFISKIIPFQVQIKTGFRHEVFKKILIFSSPFLLWGIASWLQMYSEKWIILQYLGGVVLGKYSFIYTIANIFIVIPYGVISQFIIPSIYEKSNDLKNEANLKQISFFLLLFVGVLGIITLIALFITSLFGRQLILFLGNPLFEDAWTMLPILCLGLGLFYVGQALSTLGMSLNVPRIYLKPKIITGVIAVVGNYFVVRLYGIEGIVYGLVFIGLFYLSSIIIVNKALLVRLKSLTI